MKFKKYLLIFIALFLIKEVQSQDINYSQYMLSPLYVNPAFATFDSYFYIAGQYRKQYSTPGPGYFTPSINIIKPFLNDKKTERWCGAGLHFYDDQTSTFPQVRRLGGGGTYAYNLIIGKGHNLSLGVTASYNQLQLSYDAYSSNMQYDSKTGYDPNIANGENLGSNISVNYFDLASGISYVREDTNQRILYYAGISSFHLLEPNQSVIGKSERIPRLYVFQAGIKAFQSGCFTIFPEVLAKFNKNRFAWTVGAKFDYDLNEKTKISLMPRYTHENQISAGVMLSWNDIFLMGNYDYPTFEFKDKISPAGAFELAIGYKHFIGKVKVYEVVSEKYSLNDLKKYYKMTAVEEIREAIKNQPTEGFIEEADTNWNQNRQAKYELSKQFKYGFNKTELSGEAKSFADEIALLLNDNPRMRLVVEGHTDNVGTDEINKEVSTQRSKAFIEYLKSKGIAGKRLKYVGKGETEPVTTNNSKSERSKNRRIVFKMY